MGRDATKAAGNPWYQARKKAAEYDDRLCSRESAAEQLGMSVSSLADAELGNTKFMPVDKAVLMADRYNAPWLLNHYCLNECPIGCRHSLSDEVVGIDRVTVKLLKSLKTEQLGEVKDTLLDIAADGKITEDEKPALQEVLTYLDDLAKTVSELKTIGEMALNEDGDAHGSKYVDGAYLDVKDVTETPAGDIVRPPHSVEIVVDGGDSKEIAQQILANKAGGINTVGETVVVLPGEYDEEITIRFNRPTTIYTWFRLGITLNRSEALPPNYVDLLREVVLENMDALDAGKDVVPQQFMSQLYKACSGISYIDIQLYASADASDEKPSKYPDRSKNITARQRAYTKEEMIEVEIDG